jgi:sugar phosphate isomerase/epimerase
MRFGVCAGIDRAGLLAAAGYDYIELSVAGDLVPEGSDDDWAAKRAAIDAMPLPVETFNSFVRNGKIVGPDADPERLRRYVSTAAERARQVGGAVIVFGSGGARSVPDGFPREQAADQIVEFLGFCADAYDRTGVVTVIEPLNVGECNILTTVKEGAEYVGRVNRAGVRNLADTFHMEKDGEPISHIVTYGDTIAHVHTADTGRKAPATGTYDHVALFRALRQAGYDARVSIECGWGDFAAEIGPALDRLRTAHAEAQTGA